MLNPKDFFTPPETVSASASYVSDDDSQDLFSEKAMRATRRVGRAFKTGFNNAFGPPISDKKDLQINLDHLDEIKNVKTTITEGESAATDPNISALFKVVPGSSKILYDRLMDKPFTDTTTYQIKKEYRNLEPYKVYAAQIIKDGQQMKILFFLAPKEFELRDVDEEDPDKVKIEEDYQLYVIFKNEVTGKPDIRPFGGGIFKLTEGNYADIVEVLNLFDIDENGEHSWNPEKANEILKRTYIEEMISQFELGPADSAKIFAINPNPGTSTAVESFFRRGPLDINTLHRILISTGIPIGNVRSANQRLILGPSETQIEDEMQSKKMGEKRNRSSNILESMRQFKANNEIAIAIAEAQNIAKLPDTKIRKKPENAERYNAFFSKKAGSLRKTKKQKSKRQRKTKRHRKTNKRRKHRSNKSKKA